MGLGPGWLARRAAGGKCAVAELAGARVFGGRRGLGWPGQRAGHGGLGSLEGGRRGPLNVLVLHGSPRRGGNTDILAEVMLRQAQARDVKVVHIFASGMKVKPCTGCAGCEREGRCVLDDQMARVYPLLEQSHRILVATPVYFYGVTAQLKLIIDRCQAIWSRKYVLGNPLPTHLDGLERRGYLVAVAGSSGRRVFEGVLLTVGIFLDALNVRFKDSLLVRGVDRKAAVYDHPHEIQRAEAMGEEIMSAGL